MGVCLCLNVYTFRGNERISIDQYGDDQDLLLNNNIIGDPVQYFEDSYMTHIDERIVISQKYFEFLEQNFNITKSDIDFFDTNKKNRYKVSEILPKLNRYLNIYLTKTFEFFFLFDKETNQRITDYCFIIENNKRKYPFKKIIQLLNITDDLDFPFADDSIYFNERNFYEKVIMGEPVFFEKNGELQALNVLAKQATLYEVFETEINDILKFLEKYSNTDCYFEIFWG